ncbi:MAG TPA: cupin domain-containing protein [Thermodesulfobacteriota bacterium]|nr:cupin domain-containing protein [Thermodesulfobacteriota bacterium]
MDIESIKRAIVVNVYHILESQKVPLHKHPKDDEVFYCIKGTGYGVLEDREIELTVGQAFIVFAGTKHSLRTDGDLYVTSFLIPKAEEAEPK